MPVIDKGTAGERLVENFFDKNFSRVFSFPNAKTKDNAQVADVLVWLNRIVILIEVKTRDEGTASIEDWTKGRIQHGITQLRTNFQRIKSKEQIFLNNSCYHTQLDCEGTTSIIGLIILVHDKQCKTLPSSADSEIYQKELPIHVISWNDLVRMTDEIDTVSDFFYYLQDRFQYLKISDIPLCSELDALGYYKSQSNRFSNKEVNFATEEYWQKYKTSMAAQIIARNAHNQYSKWLDRLEQSFDSQRKLYDGIPIGLYFAWELGNISRRERAYLGEKLNSVESWFEKGKNSRQFAWYNCSTGNWFVLYFSKLEPRKLQNALMNIMRLRLIKEVHNSNFDYAVYGFGFQVSITYPHQLLSLASTIIMAAEEVKGKYTSQDLEDSRIMWGDPSSVTTKKIHEFPER